MQPKLPISEVERLKAQVRWLEEQLNGHEDNFGKQIDKINHLSELLENTQEQLLKAEETKSIDDAKLASLASYITALEDTPLLKVFKPSIRQELRRTASVAAYEAAAYKNLIEQLSKLLEIDVPEGEEHALVKEAREMLSKVGSEIGYHRKKICDTV